jgi:hypothetical protein
MPPPVLLRIYTYNLVVAIAEKRFDGDRIR